MAGVVARYPALHQDSGFAYHFQTALGQRRARAKLASTGREQACESSLCSHEAEVLTVQGDNDKSIASKTSHHILQLLQAHPAMKAVVAREVSALVLKPPTVSAEPSSSHVRFDDKPAAAPAKAEGVSHARYYGLITLNQITLTSHESDTAGRLVELYFEIFREILGDGKVEEEAQDHVEKVAGKVEKWRGRRKGSKPKGGRKSALEDEELIDASEARLVAAVLTGINRAMPYAKLDEEM